MKPYTLLLILSLCTACFGHQSPEVTDQPPTTTNTDYIYANVFKPWEGKWKGQFHTFTATHGQQTGKAQPKNLSLTYFNELDLQPNATIEVEQEYISVNPFFQKVWIRDTYKNEQGELQRIESQGVNKVENGQLWCVVHKPEETVIHQGSSVSKNTITWERHLHSPLKIEYFWEEVIENTYTIIGWGYYNGDNPKQTPKTWFYGRYEKEF